MDLSASIPGSPPILPFRVLGAERRVRWSLFLKTLESEPDGRTGTDEALGCTSVSGEAQGWEARAGGLGGFKQEPGQKRFVGQESWGSIPGRRRHQHICGDRRTHSRSFRTCVYGLHLTEEKTRLWEVKTCPLSQPVDTARAPSRTHSASPRSRAVSTAKGAVTKVKQTSLVPSPQSPLDWGSMSCCRSPF